MSAEWPPINSQRGLAAVRYVLIAEKECAKLKELIIKVFRHL